MIWTGRRSVSNGRGSAGGAACERPEPYPKAHDTHVSDGLLSVREVTPGSTYDKLSIRWAHVQTSVVTPHASHGRTETARWRSIRLRYCSDATAHVQTPGNPNHLTPQNSLEKRCPRYEAVRTRTAHACRSKSNHTRAHRLLPNCSSGAYFDRIDDGSNISSSMYQSAKYGSTEQSQKSELDACWYSGRERSPMVKNSCVVSC